MGKFNSIYKLVGPGIIWAATSIGVSHIVQATRAGAEYGFSLLGIVLLAHVIKFPFFQIGPQYAASTGESLLDGYKRLGNWAFYSFLALTFFTMFFVQAAVTIVTSALAINLFGSGLSLAVWSALILISVALVLILGRFKWLSESLKWMVLILAILSITTLLIALNKYGIGQSEFQPVPSLSTPMAIAFVVALIGWMPTSIEVSVWHSMWSIKRLKKIVSKDERVSLALLDFRIGYITSFILAVVFLWLGVIILFGHDFSFSQSAGKFAGQLVSVYTNALGNWSFSLIALICFIALFSTTFAVSDGFPQVWANAISQLTNQQSYERRTYIISLVLLSAVSWLIIAQFTHQIKSLIDLVTTISFVSAPVFAWLNLKVIGAPHVERSYRPSGFFKWYAYVCLVMMTLFSLFYVYWRFWLA